MNTTFQNITAKYLTFSASFDNGAELFVDVYVFLEDGIYSVSQEEFAAKTHSFKLSFTVKNWDSAEGQSQLRLRLKYKVFALHFFQQDFDFRRYLPFRCHNWKLLLPFCSHKC